MFSLQALVCVCIGLIRPMRTPLANNQLLSIEVGLFALWLVIVITSNYDRALAVATVTLIGGLITMVMAVVETVKAIFTWYYWRKVGKLPGGRDLKI